ARGVSHRRLQLDRPDTGGNVRVARAGRVEAWVAILARLPRALVDNPAIAVDAVLEPPLDERTRVRIDLREPLAIQRAQIQQLEAEERQTPRRGRPAAAAVGGDHVVLTAPKHTRH